MIKSKNLLHVFWDKQSLKLNYALLKIPVHIQLQILRKYIEHNIKT